MDIRSPRVQWTKRHPIQYRVQLPVELLGCGGTSPYPIPWVDTSADLYSFIGWLMVQHGVPARQLCTHTASQVVIAGNSLVPKRQVDIPSPLRWLAKDECARVLGDDIRGNLDIPTPCCFVDEPDPHGNDVSGTLCKVFELLNAVNNAKVAMELDSSIVTMDLPTRIFWLREISRKYGVGVQVL